MALFFVLGPGYAGGNSVLLRVTGKVDTARPFIADFSLFMRISMNWRSIAERLVLSSRRYRLMLFRCVRRRTNFSSIIAVIPFDVSPFTKVDRLSSLIAIKPLAGGAAGG